MKSCISRGGTPIVRGWDDGSFRPGTAVRMPEISRFFGIIIRMYAEAGEPHHRPHFHAYYQDNVAIYAIDEIEALAGALPRKQQRLVEAWAELHQGELNADWALLQEGHPPRKIEPLA